MRQFLSLVLFIASIPLIQGQALDAIPFEPLGPPDTLRSVAAVRALEATGQVVYAAERRIAGTAEDAVEPWIVLVKPWNAAWLVYTLPVWRERQGEFKVLGFTEDGHYLRLSQWSGHLSRGYEISATDLYLIDLERAAFATLNTHRWEQAWNTDDTTDLHGHISIDSAVVTITSDHVYVINGCVEDGVPVPCERSGAAYAITATALVLDPMIDVAPVAAHDQDPPAPLTAYDLERLERTDRMCPRYQGPHNAHVALDSTDRMRLLQQEGSRYRSCVLRYGARLPDAQGAVITLYCDRDDDHDLLWLAYDNAGTLVGFDTLASQWGDGQLIRWECASVDAYGRLQVVVMEEETLRDEVDTMAYRRDTLMYEVRPLGISILEDEGEVRDTYVLERIPLDLTGRWVEKHGANDRGARQWRSVKELIAPDRRVLQSASGDLNRDGAEDHVFVLTDAEDSGARDLLIAFTAADRGRFVQHALLEDFLPDKRSGGFHDPIGEEGISGISIQADTLVIRQFGGSAWKWQSEAKYVFDAPLQDLYLVEERGRSYHAPSLETQDAELAELESFRTRSRLNTGQLERYTELKKMVADAAWKVERFLMGAKPMRP